MSWAPPPQANLLAIGSQDSVRLASLETDLQGRGRYAEIWRPHPHWLIAVKPFPGSTPDPETLRRAGYAFALGRDAVPAPLPAAETLSGWQGDFCFFHVDPGGKLLAVRACAGQAPVYWSCTAQDTVVATEAAALITDAGWRGELDPLSAALQTAGMITALGHRTHLSGVRQLEPGECIALRPGVPSEPRRYWMPLPQQVPPRSAESEHRHRRALRDLLIGKLERGLDPRGGNLVAFSGGVDSSCVLALAARTLERAVMTWSVLPPARFTQIRALAVKHVGALRGLLHTGHHWEADATPASFEAAADAGAGVPRPAQSSLLPHLAKIRQEADVRVLCGGDFADQIVGSSYTLPDWCAATGALELLRSRHRWPLGWSALPRWLKVRLKYLSRRPYLLLPDALPEYCPPRLQEEYADFHSQVRERIADYPRQHRNLFVHHLTLDGPAMQWETYGALGIRICSPFWTREAIELTVDCHPAELVGPGYKRLLRGALAGDVPAEQLQREDKGVFAWPKAELVRESSPLRLEDDTLWGPLERMVDPAWRARITREGRIDWETMICLKQLQRLRADVSAAQSGARSSARASSTSA